MVSDQDSGRSVSHPAGIGIHKNAESGLHSISGMDGLFKRHAPVYGGSEHGNQGKYPPVSYTHLDVYKRQRVACRQGIPLLRIL